MPEPRAKKKKGPQGPFKASGRRTSAFAFALIGLVLLLAAVLLALRLLLLLFVDLLIALLLLLPTGIPVLVALVHHVSPDALRSMTKRVPCPD
jgi:hypothetical protein